MNGVIILSRLDSRRLPGKALINIQGKTLLEWCIESLSGDKDYKIIIATTKRKVDDPIIEIAKKRNIDFFRGEKDNVAKRVLDCAKSYNLKAFARINGDSPFVRKSLIKFGFEKINTTNCDFVTNLVPRMFPYGIAVEVFDTKIYEKTFREIVTENHKEHVTTYFYENLEKFNACFIKYRDGKTNDHHIRLVVDYKEDLILFGRVLELVADKIQTIKVKELVAIYNKLKT